jgi:hypothetical protein
MENLRPRGIGEVIDAAIALYKARFGALVKLTALVVVPVQLLNVLVTLSTAPSEVTFGATGPTPVYDSRTSFWVPFAGTVVMNVVTILSTAFATAAVMRLVAGTYVGQASAVGDSARLAWHRFPAVIGASFVTGILTIIGFAACIVPGLYLQAMFSVTIPALLLESLGVRAAIRRSTELSRGRRWQCFAVLYVGSLLAGAIAFGLTLLIDVPVDAALDGTTALAIAQGVAGALTAALTTPFQAAAIIVLYFDLRVRGEGFDVQMALQRLDRARTAVPSIAAT